MVLKLSLKKVNFITNKDLIIYYKKNLDNNLFAIEMFLKQLDFNLSKDLEATVIFDDELEDTSIEFTSLILKKDENNRFDLNKIIKDDLLSSTDNGLNKDIALKYFTIISTDYDNKKIEYESGSYKLNFPDISITEKGNFNFPLTKLKKQVSNDIKEDTTSTNTIKSTNDIEKEEAEKSKTVEILKAKIRNEIEKEYLEIQKSMFISNQEIIDENKKLKTELKIANENIYALKNEAINSKGILFPSVEDFSDISKNVEINRLITSTTNIFEEENLLKKFGVDQKLSVFDRVEAEFIKGKLNRQALIGLKENYLNNIEHILSIAKEELLIKYTEIKGINISEFVENTQDFKTKKVTIKNTQDDLLNDFKTNKKNNLKSKLEQLFDIHEKQISALATKLKADYLEEEKKLSNFLDIEIEEFKEQLENNQYEEIQSEKENMIAISTESFYNSSLEEREHIINKVIEKIRNESLRLTQSLDSAIEEIQVLTSSNHEMIKNKAGIIIAEKESKEKIALEREKVTLSNSQLKQLEKELQSSTDDLINTKEKYNTLLSEMEELKNQKNLVEQTNTQKGFFNFGK